MKHLKHLLTALVFVSIIVFTSCGGGKGGDNIDPAEEQAEKLSATWTLDALGAVNAEGPQASWDGMTLTVADNPKTYNVSGSQCIETWPLSGTWTFDGSDIGTVIRNDGVSIEISSVTSSELTLVFNISGNPVCTPPVRSESAGGLWTFSFSK